MRSKQSIQKSPLTGGLFKLLMVFIVLPIGSTDRLLDFAFFVDHVFANYGIKFFDLHFLWHGAFVFVSGIKMASAG